MVDENDAATGFVAYCGEFTHCLRHKSCLKTDAAVADFAVDFCLRSKRRDAVHDDKVDAVASDKRFGNVQSLFAAVGLRDVQVVDLNAESLRVIRIERVLRVDKRRHTALFLCFCDHMKRDGRFARRFGPVNFDNSAARNAAYAESDVKSKTARGDCFDLLNFGLAEFHNRALTELFFYLL